jgi:hypothetical protein
VPPMGFRGRAELPAARAMEAGIGRTRRGLGSELRRLLELGRVSWRKRRRLHGGLPTFAESGAEVAAVAAFPCSAFPLNQGGKIARTGYR